MLASPYKYLRPTFRLSILSVLAQIPGMGSTGKVVIRECMGIEALADSTGKHAVSEHRGAESGALTADFYLSRVIMAWPALSGTVRAAILALVDRAVVEADGRPTMAVWAPRPSWPRQQRTVHLRDAAVPCEQGRIGSLPLTRGLIADARCQLWRGVCGTIGVSMDGRGADSRLDASEQIVEMRTGEPRGERCGQSTERAAGRRPAALAFHCGSVRSGQTAGRSFIRPMTA